MKYSVEKFDNYIQFGQLYSSHLPFRPDPKSGIG